MGVVRRRGKWSAAGLREEVGGVEMGWDGGEVMMVMVGVVMVGVVALCVNDIL